MLVENHSRKHAYFNSRAPLRPYDVTAGNVPKRTRTLVSLPQLQLEKDVNPRQLYVLSFFNAFGPEAM